MLETRFVTPDRARTADLVATALRDAGERAAPASWQWIEHGSANLVVLAGSAAVRVGRTAAASAESIRAQHLVDDLPVFPFAVPRSLGEPHRDGGLVAIVQRRLDGIPHPSGHGDPDALGTLLDALAEVPVGPREPHLATPHAFMGGDRWHAVMVEQAIPLLDRAARDRARKAADALAALEPVGAGLVHGDLAGSNVLWSDGVVSGVIDWDLASAGDSAVDVAALAVWHGWDALERVRSRDVIARARVIAATHPLQVLCFSIVNERPESERRRAAEWASSRM
ncbi:MAG: putative aminoglycoside phosphotransferase [Microbacterium sp.]|jgi:aminoglycoside phosphotransferase (APT) family kinase protein|nr:putative aminoglycoside phosphotransferase [Microbacterium sp.]